MIELITACLIVSIIVLVILVAWVVIMGIWHFKKDKKHKLEKAELQKQKDYHCKELEKRYGVQNESKGYELGERGDNR